jgi:3-deoxy-7-phosphoheptulonate synthase
MDPAELVQLIDVLNPENRAGRITIITRMGPENMRVKLPHLIRAVRGAGQIVTWVTDPMHGNTMKAPCGLKTRSFDRILVILFACYLISMLGYLLVFMSLCQRSVFFLSE